MSSKHLSVRIEEDTLERLEIESRRTGQSRSQLVKLLIDEGLRMEAHLLFRRANLSAYYTYRAR